MKDEELKYWLAFNAIGNIGSRTFAKLSSYFPSLKEAWISGYSELLKSGIKSSTAKKISELKIKIDPAVELEKVKKHRLKIITIEDDNYPSRLKEISDPPYILYCKGDIIPEDEIAIAIVGSRKFSSYGKRVCEKIIPQIASMGITVVSGLALGIDTFAHHLALENRGRTIAVLAGGLDKIYPSNNYQLAERIANGNGAIISEYHPGSPCYATNFPVRNRIIAGLAMGTLIIEAGERSGSLLTARAALDYNRDVYSIPGDITRETSVGANGLIKMGAKPVTRPEDIIEEFNLGARSKQAQAKKILPDTKEEAVVLKYLGSEPTHIDKLAQITNLEISKLNSTLVMMEMKGKARNLGANQYVLNL